MDDRPSDIILPETIDIPHEEPKPQKSSKKLIFVILAIIAFLGLIISLTIVIVNSNQKTESTTEEPTDETAQTIGYDSEEFNSAIAFASGRFDAGDYVTMEYTLKQYSLVERMTVVQKYRYYALMAKLYSEVALNDPELSARYSALAEENLIKIRGGED